MQMTRISTRLCLLLVAIAWLVAPLTPAEAGAPAVSQIHRDPVHKFSLKYFKDWKPVPLQPGETDVVCRLRDPKQKGTLRGTLDPSIEIVRIRTSGTDEVTTGSPEAAPTQRMPPGMQTAEDAWDATIGAELGIGGYGRKPPKKIPLPKDEFKETKSKDKPKIIGKLYAGEFSSALYYSDVKVFVMLGVFERDGVELGVYCKCGLPLRKAYEKKFKQVIKSFKFRDDKAKDVEQISSLDGVNISPKRRRYIEKSLVKGWAVIVSPKKNYIVVYNTKGNRNHALAEEIA